MLKIAECTSLQALEALRAEWDDLLDRVAQASIFATWEWSEACWRFAAPGKQPIILIARDADDRLVGILPLARTSRFRLLGTLEVLGCNPAGYPMGDYGGLIAARGVEEDVLVAMLRHLKANRKWSVIDLRNCMADSPSREEQLSRLYNKVASDLSWGVRVGEAALCRVIPLPASFDEYLAELGAKTRGNIRAKLRKLQKAEQSLGAVDVADEATRVEALDAFFYFHQQRWAKDEMGGGFRDDRVRDMHQHLGTNLAARGWLDLRMIRSAEGEVRGVIYNFKRNGTIYNYHIGFNQDKEWFSYSLGACLLADSIASAIESGCHTFDFMRGDHEYKQHFGGHTTNNVRITIYRYNWLPKAEEAAKRLRRRFQRRPTMHLDTSPMPE